jgi:hypothetical protein
MTNSLSGFTTVGGGVGSGPLTKVTAHPPQAVLVQHQLHQATSRANKNKTKPGGITRHNKNKNKKGLEREDNKTKQNKKQNEMEK